MNNEYKGVWPVMLTPFNESGRIDYECYRRLLDWYVEQGVHGIFSVCGSSEMFLLDENERLELARIAVEQCAGKIPVIATGSLGEDFEAHKRFSLKLADIGVDAVILLLPSFCKTEAETLDYLLRMADAVPCDLGVYECPGIGIGHLSPESVKILAETGRFGPFKETSCEIETITKHVEVAKGTGLSVLQANVPFMVDAHHAGSSGIMGISMNVVPGLAAGLYRNLCAGKSVEKQHQLICLVDSLLRLGYPVSAKFILSMRGFPIRETMRAESSTPLSNETRKLIEEGFNYILGEIEK